MHRVHSLRRTSEGVRFGFNHAFGAQCGALDAEFGFFEAAREGFRLVQAGHQDGQFDGFGHALNLMEFAAPWRARVLIQPDEIPVERAGGGAEVERDFGDDRGVHLLEPDFKGAIEPLADRLLAQQNIFDLARLQIRRRVAGTDVFDPARTERAPQRRFRIVKRDHAQDFQARRQDRAGRGKAVVAPAIDGINLLDAREQMRIRQPGVF